VRNFDAGGSWFARMDTAVHEGFHALVGKHLPSVWKAGDATLFKIPVGAPIKYVEEVFAYAVGRGGALQFHGIPFAPIEAFGSLSRGEAITTIIFGVGAYGTYEYFND
jgi:large repetitive protein